MKQRRLNCCSAALLAVLSLGTSDAFGRDTAGPEPPSDPEKSGAEKAGPEKPGPEKPAPEKPGAVAASPPARQRVDARARLSSAVGTEAPARVTGADAPEAAGEPSSADAERAKQLYAAGAEAFAAQRNADAIGYFRRAAELVPSAKLTYNIGLAYEEMGDNGRALAEYRSYLGQERDADPGRIEEVRARIAKLEQRLAETGVQQLLVTSDPPGATVRIAGRALGVTPWAGELAPGRHLLELDLAGHLPRQAEVTLAPDRSTELALALEPTPGPPLRVAEDAGGSHLAPLAWTFLGVGGGSLAAGVAFELSRASSSHDADRASDPVDAARARGAADAKQMASVLLLGAGAGFSIAGAVMLVLDRDGSNPPPSQTALDMRCAPRFCGVVTRGQF